MVEQASNTRWHIDIILCDGFVLSELAAITDTLRICNRTVANHLFSWSFLAEGGGVRRNDCGVMVDTQTIPVTPSADFLFVLGNSDPANPALSVAEVLRRYRFAGSKVYLLAEAATRYISESDAEEGLSTHWENSTILQEQYGRFDTAGALASDNGSVVTSAGMESTVDLVLSLIGQLLSAPVQMTVSNVLLHETVRDLSTLQPSIAQQSSLTCDQDLDRCIRMMQENIEDPLPIGDLVARLGISPRSLERKFKAYLGKSPNTFYREIRLHRANNLLLNTTLSVGEVGMACGFANGFSGLYKSFFGVTPSSLRKTRRAGKNTG